MIINRRTALASLGVAVASGFELLTSKVAAFGIFEETGSNQMNADLARLGKHLYSEEGIPMLLACENAGIEHSPLSHPSDFSERVATAFHRYSAEWQHLHPDAPPSDVAKIVELLAERDFASGGSETGL